METLSEIFQKYFKILQKYFKILQKYFKILQKYFKILQKYFKILQKYFKILQKYFKILQKYFKILQKYSKKIFNTPDNFQNFRTNSRCVGKYMQNVVFLTVSYDFIWNSFMDEGLERNGLKASCLS